VVTSLHDTRHEAPNLLDDRIGQDLQPPSAAAAQPKTDTKVLWTVERSGSMLWQSRVRDRGDG